MRRTGLILLVGICVVCFSNVFAQKTLSVSNNSSFEKVKFKFCATDGQCLISPGNQAAILNIERQSSSISSPQFVEEIIEGIKQIHVKFDEHKDQSLGATLSRRFFSDQEEDEYKYKMYLSKLKPLDLDLNYAIGNSYIDLSDLSIERLKLHTGSANVTVNYKEGLGNKIAMDTFLIKVDMGTFEAMNLHLSRSEHIIANVGFGKVKMDFADAQSVSTNVQASVGAGKLEIILPASGVPVKININDSQLCRIKMPDEFRESEGKVFVNNHALADQTDYINFDVDVAVGNIVFKSAEK